MIKKPLKDMEDITEAWDLFERTFRHDVSHMIAVVQIARAKGQQLTPIIVHETSIDFADHVKNIGSNGKMFPAVEGHRFIMTAVDRPHAITFVKQLSSGKGKGVFPETVSASAVEIVFLAYDKVIVIKNDVSKSTARASKKN